MPRRNELNRLKERNEKNLVKDNMVQVMNKNAVAQKVKNKYAEKEY